MRLPIVVVMMLLVAPGARAQPHRNEAKELYEKATRHYELGEYDRAIEEYKRAYELSAAPALLFNLGQVYRLKKEPEQALRFYSNYLRLQPNAPNRADAEGFIAEMRAAIEAQKKPPTIEPAPASPSPPATTAAPAPAPAVTSAPTATKAAPPPRAKHWRAELGVGIGVAAGGLVLTITGIALGAVAKSDADQLSRAALMHNQTWDATRSNLYTQGQRDGQAALALDIIGPVLLAGGVVIGLVARHDQRLWKQFAVDGRGVACAF